MRSRPRSRNAAGWNHFAAFVIAVIGVPALAIAAPPDSLGEPLFVSGSAGPQHAEMLPPDHPAWQDIEALWNRGGLASLPVFTRPLPRADIAAAWKDLETSLRESNSGQRLARELAFELQWSVRGGLPAETGPLLDLSPEDGTSTRIQIRGEARMRATTTDDEGEVVPGTRGGAVARAYIPGGLFALADVWAEKIVDSNPIGDALVKNSDWYLSTEDAYLSLRMSAGDLLFGLGENRWGPGGSGTLLLSDAALSYPSLQFARTFAKSARFTALIASLHQPETLATSPITPGPRLWFAAHRLEFGLGSRVRVGLHEAAAFRSDGPEFLYAVGVVPYTLVQRLLDRTTADGASLDPNRNNVLVGIDAVWRVGGGVRLDGEFLIDDFATESSSQPDRLGFQGGASWSGDVAGASADARIEFVKVYQYTYAVFYDADFIHDRVPLGYGRGPDVEFAELWAERDAGLNMRWGLGVELQRRGEGLPGEAWDPTAGGSRTSGADLSGVIERSVYPHVRFRGAWRDVAELRLHAGALEMKNVAHRPGDDDTALHLRADLRVQW